MRNLDRNQRRRSRGRAIGRNAIIIALVTMIAGLAGPADRAFAGPTLLNGSGSQFAAPAITQWDANASQRPYSLSVNYTPSSSGQGRYEFTNETVDFAVSDTGYVNSSVGTTPPSFPFQFIPVTAAGVAFMYNVPNLTKALQLTSYTACLLLTGQIKNWDDPALEQNGANAGVTLPDLPVVPVTESDPAGTNYVLEEYCIHEQPSVWATYIKDESGFPAPSGVAITNTPGSNWEAPGNGYDEQSTAAVASNIANTPGAIGPVQEQYAIDSGFTKSPSQSVADVQNASGDFTAPDPLDVASALAYATQQTNGTHVLNFDGLGKYVYNPSTYSYLLTPTTGWVASKGAVLSAYVNYVLTLGQQVAPSMDFASLGLSLERYGIDTVTQLVPGAVAPTSSEDSAYSCGDFTPTEVQNGATAPTCGVTNGAPPPAPPGATNVVTTNGNPSSTSKTGATISSKSGTAGAKTPTGGTSAPGTSADGSSADPSVSLSGTPSMAYTGGDPTPWLIIGLLLTSVGFFARRRIGRALRVEAPR